MPKRLSLSAILTKHSAVHSSTPKEQLPSAVNTIMTPVQCDQRKILKNFHLQLNTKKIANNTNTHKAQNAAR